MKTVDQRVQDLAAAQGNVVSRGELLAIGLTDHMIGTLVRRLRWRALQRGVYLAGMAPPTWEQACLAALKAAPESVLDGETGLAAWDVDGAKRGAIHLLVPRHCGPEVNGVVVHRTTISDKPRRCGLLQTASIERLLVDFAAVASTERAEQAVESALARGLTAERRLWELVAQLPERLPGVGRLTRILELRPLGKPARSKLEIELFKVVKSGGLPLPVRNFDVYVEGRRFELDMAYPDQLGAIEADSRRFHGTKSQRKHDDERQQILESIGYRFRRFTWRDVFGRPAWVVEQVRDLLADGVVALNASQPRQREVG